MNGILKPVLGVGGMLKHPVDLGDTLKQVVDARKWHGKDIIFIFGKTHGASIHVAEEYRQAMPNGDA